MASVQFTLSPPSSSIRSSPSFACSSITPQSSTSTKDLSSFPSCSKLSSRLRNTNNVNKYWKSSDCRWTLFTARSSLETTGLTATVGQVTEISKDTFWPIVKSAGDKTVALDMYTQWCGPCKVMAPKFQELAEKYDDVVFLKLDCNQENKPLAKELGIRVVPTFKILKDSKIVKEVTGAKFDDLVLAINTVRAS